MGQFHQMPVFYLFIYLWLEVKKRHIFYWLLPDFKLVLSAKCHLWFLWKISCYPVVNTNSFVAYFIVCDDYCFRLFLRLPTLPIFKCWALFNLLRNVLQKVWKFFNRSCKRKTTFFQSNITTFLSGFSISSLFQMEITASVTKNLHEYHGARYLHLHITFLYIHCPPLLEKKLF